MDPTRPALVTPVHNTAGAPYLRQPRPISCRSCEVMRADELATRARRRRGYAERLLTAPRPPLVFTLLALVLITWAGVLGAETATPLQQAIAERLASDWRPPLMRKTDERRLVWEGVGKIYAQRQNEPLWQGTRERDRRREELGEILSASATHGLVPDEYRAMPLLLAERGGEEARWPRDRLRAAAWDLELTAALLGYAYDMWDGRVEPQDIAKNHNVYLERPRLDPVALIRNIQKQGLAPALEALVPTHPHYQALREELARLLEAEPGESLPELRHEGLLRPGDRGRFVRQLRARLAELDLHPGPALGDAEADLYDPELADAVRKFQASRALNNDGIVGPETLAALNKPLHERAEQLAVNLDRWRWLPRSLGEHYLMVNIPEYRLRVFRGGRLELEMPVIVGSEAHQTPLFSDRMEEIVFSPYWNVPWSITENELLPQIRDDRAVLEEKNLEILDYEKNVLDPERLDFDDLTANDILIRQKPGPENSLGQVKFMFPNTHAIYLHDTPADELFTKTRRDFSHGCIRVERPAELAAYLLAGREQWTERAIRAAMSAGQEQEVALNEELPVYLTYFTAVPSAEGEVTLLADVYDHDRLMLAAMEDESPQPVVAVQPAAPRGGAGGAARSPRAEPATPNR